MGISINLIHMVHVCVPSCSVFSDSLQPHGLYPTRPLCPWDFLGKNTGVGYHFLLQGIFPTQGSNPCLLCLQHQQVGSLPRHHLGSSSWVHAWIQITKYQGAMNLYGNVIGLIKDLLSLIPRRISIKNQFPFWSISSIRNMCTEHCTIQREWFLEIWGLKVSIPIRRYDISDPQFLNKTVRINEDIWNPR